MSENMWVEYKALLETMRHNYELWQQLSNEAWGKYSEIWQKTIESSPELQKRITEAWNITSNEVGMEQIKKFGEMWENTLKISSFDAMNAFSRYWQKFWMASTAEQFKVYREALQKFTEQQQNIWKK